MKRLTVSFLALAFVFATACSGGGSKGETDDTPKDSTSYSIDDDGTEGFDEPDPDETTDNPGDTDGGSN